MPVKNSVLIFFIGFLVINRGYSQSSFEIGVSGGAELNFPSSFNKEMIRPYEPVPGFNIGVSFRHNFGLASFIYGLEYARMNFNYHNDPATWPVMAGPKQMNLSADQIRIPLLFQVNAGSKKSQFFANGGFCALFGVKRYPDRSELTFGDDSPIYYPGEIVNDINIGFMSGLGYSYAPIPWLRLLTGARFLLPLIANNNSGGSENAIRTLGASWLIGVSFKTSRR